MIFFWRDTIRMNFYNNPSQLYYEAAKISKGCHTAKITPICGKVNCLIGSTTSLT